MKKKSLVVLFGFVLAFLFAGGAVRASVLFKGMKGEAVTEIQEILKEDASIYPEGLVTGYFGPLTEKAVKRLQAKFGLAQTGKIDSETEAKLFPVIKYLKVKSPNGGEVLDRGEIQTIEWEVNPWLEPTKEEPLWAKASIDLFRRRKINILRSQSESSTSVLPIEKSFSVFVKHIAFVNLYDGTYSWKISPEIKNGSDYVIRITVGKRLVGYWRNQILPQEVWPSGEKILPVDSVPPAIYWDESDAPFTITGETPTPSPALEPIIELLEEAIRTLNKALQLLRGMMD